MNYVAHIKPACISCGEALHDDGPEQTDAWLASMCGECFKASEASTFVDPNDHAEYAE
jgi:hypothetical protein